MKLISVVDYPRPLCNAPGTTCKNPAKHIVNLQTQKFQYKAYRLCTAHLESLKGQCDGAKTTK